MFRAFTAASILVLAATAAHAGPSYSGWGAPLPQTANDVCGQLLQSRNETKEFYRSWYNNCMRSTGAEITRQVEARAATGRSTMVASR